MNTNIIFIAVGVLFIFYIIGIYNGFIILKTRIEEALSGIDVQLKRRVDLIPNVIETVKGYAKHEKELFENVTKARTSFLSAKTVHEKADANNQMTETLKSLFAVAEGYPDLKANANFQELQRQLEDTEDKIAYSRQFYNGNVLDYNAKVKTFPSNVIAGMFGFASYEFFQATGEERKNVEVKF